MLEALVAAEQREYTVGYLAYLALIVVAPLLWIIVPRVFNLLDRRQAINAARSSSRLSRLQALQFVEDHKELKSLSDEDALTVARVLTETLQEQARRGRRFDIGLTTVSMLSGALVGRLLS